HWGSARLVAQATVRDTIAASYQLSVADLRTALRRTRGSLSLAGTAQGPRMTPRVRARVEARNLASGTLRLGQLAGTADIDLAPRGRNDVELAGRQGGFGNTVVDSVRVSLRGTHNAHQLLARARGPRDSLQIRLAGGLAAGRWRGRLNALALQSGSWGGWQLEHPARLALSRAAGRVDSLCLAADSAAGQLCATGDWRSSRTWNVLATLDGIPVERLPIGHPGASLDIRGRLTGSLAARIDAHALAGRITGTLRAETDSVAYLWQRNVEKGEHRYALDSAVVAIRADRQSGMVATLGVRLTDERRHELAALAGNLSMPDYVMGSHLLRRPISWKLDGSASDLAFLEPFLFAVDSLRGSVLLAASGSGSLRAPQVKATLGVQRFALGFPGRKAATGGLELAVDGGLGEDRRLAGEAHLISRGLGWDYWYYAQHRRLSVDSGSVVLSADSAGTHGRLGFAVHDAQGTGIASLDGSLELPEYRRYGDPLGPQPVTLSLTARVPDLQVLQPLVLSADSLAGRLALDLSAKGRVGSPQLIGALRVDSARGRLPTGSMARGSLRGDLDMLVARDRSLTGSLTLTPVDARLSYPVGDGTTSVLLDSTAFSLTSAGDGVQGALDMRFADTNHVVMGTLVGRASLPQLKRVDASLGAQPVEAWLEGRAADLAFLESLTPQVDSAAGRLHLGVKLDGRLSGLHTIGSIELDSMAARLPFLGILLEDVQFRGRGDQAGSIEVDGTLHSGGGELTLSGQTPVQPSSAHPGQLHLKATRFEAMDNAELHALLTGTADVRLAEDSLQVRGDITVPLAHQTLTQIPATAIAPSDDVMLLDSLLVLRRNRPVTAHVKIALGDSVSFSGFNFNAELGGTMELSQEADELPKATGTMYIEEGRYKAYGQDLRIKKGEVRFTGGPIDNPELSVTATRTAFSGAEQVTAGIRILGTLKDPEVSLFSEPAMSETQILSYILTGAPVGAAAGGSLLDRAMTSLGLRGGNLLGPTLGQQVGLEQAKFSTARDVRSTSLAFGRFLTPSLYVSYGIGVFDPISTLRLRYVLSNRFTLLAEAGKVTSADALLKIEASKKPNKQ
ncbi:MAG TPA: translocation/assembly module TamB domain-containing protein, partial [Gemmatimonadales bacterium]|nr:translocation/assembly module TamB domain-containing protein [Gemmatimonadales bacterium]